jgi:hypothetical protein
MEGNRRKSRLVPVMIVVGLLCVVLAVYVVGYFYGCEEYTLVNFMRTRTFNWKWPCIVYAPAARLEAATFDLHVALCYPTPDRSGDYECYAVYEP